MLTGFNTFVDYLHTKILLAGVLGEAPTTISGSANWSEASTNSNDENMLIIAGDRDVADVYFTEYMRIFQHFYARWWAANSAPATLTATVSSAEDDTWQGPYFGTGPKSQERDLFANQVAGNT